MSPTFTLTSQSLTITLDGITHTLQHGSPQFIAARKAVLDERWDDLAPLLSPPLKVERWLSGHFAVEDGAITYDGVRINPALNERIIHMAYKDVNPSGWIRFWERLQANPSYRSVQQLYSFLVHEGIPIDETDGHILAYKSVTADFRDHHTGRFDNRPGITHEMPRNQISDDPQVPCHDGFHVGALAYAEGFGGEGRKIVVCKVDPADVVCVPYDHDAMKVRVCRYTVVGLHNGELLPSTVLQEAPPVVEVTEPSDDEVSDLPIDGTGALNWLLVMGTRQADVVHKAKIDSGTVSRVAQGKAKFGAVSTAKLRAAFPAAFYPGMDKMSEQGLMRLSLSLLQAYATEVLQIIDVARIPKGKAGLVRRILESR